MSEPTELVRAAMEKAAEELGLTVVFYDNEAVFSDGTVMAIEAEEPA